MKQTDTSKQNKKNCLKKLMLIALFSSIIISGCTETTSSTEPAQSISSSAAEVASSISEAPVLSSESSSKYEGNNLLLQQMIVTLPIKNGDNTQTIGMYGYIEFDKTLMKDIITENDFNEFYEVAIKDKLDFKRFTIDFKDGTGLMFTGQNIVIPYGTLDDNRMVSQPLGYVSFDGTNYTYSSDSDTTAPTSEVSDNFMPFRQGLDTLGIKYTETPMAAEMVGAETGVKFKLELGGQIELYSFEPNSDALAKASSEHALTVQGFGSFPAEVNGRYAMLISDIADVTPILDLFSKLK